MPHFIATPAPGKARVLPELEALIVDLLHRGSVQLPAALFVGKMSYEPRYSEEEDNEDNAENRGKEIAAFYKVAPQYYVDEALT